MEANYTGETEIKVVGNIFDLHLFLIFFKNSSKFIF
jgi:hypothetical protein